MRPQRVVEELVCVPPLTPLAGRFTGTGPKKRKITSLPPNQVEHGGGLGLITGARTAVVVVVWGIHKRKS